MNPILPHTPDEKKLALQKAAEDLFTSLDGEFGKAATAKLKAKPKSKKEKPLSSSQQGEKQFMAETLRLAALIESAVWRPVARTHFIIDQSCSACHQVTTYIGGEHIRHEHRRTKAIWEIARPDAADFTDLPHIIHRTSTKISLCHICLMNKRIKPPLTLAVLDEPLIFDDSGEESFFDEEAYSEANFLPAPPKDTL